MTIIQMQLEYLSETINFKFFYINLILILITDTRMTRIKDAYLLVFSVFFALLLGKSNPSLLFKWGNVPVFHLDRHLHYKQEELFIHSGSSLFGMRVMKLSS